MSDPVNHPEHYNRHPSGVECITIVEHMTFNAGNAVKYLWRAGLKDADVGERAKHIEDLQKAAWCVQREIERLTRAAPQYGSAPGGDTVNREAAEPSTSTDRGDSE